MRPHTRPRNLLDPMLLQHCNFFKNGSPNKPEIIMHPHLYCQSKHFAKAKQEREIPTSWLTSTTLQRSSKPDRRNLHVQRLQKTTEFAHSHGEVQKLYRVYGVYLSSLTSFHTKDTFAYCFGHTSSWSANPQRTNMCSWHWSKNINWPKDTLQVYRAIH